MLVASESRGIDNYLRRALRLASKGAIRKASRARELYDRLRADGKSYGRVLRAGTETMTKGLGYSPLCL